MICDLLNSIHRALGCCTPRIQFRLGAVRETAGAITKTPALCRRLRSGGYYVATTITVTQQFKVTAEFLDKKGNPAKVDGAPAWATDNTDVLALTPSADGLSCDVIAVGMIGTGTVQVVADADLGAGVVPVIGTLEVAVTAGAAAVVTLTAGAPTEQP